MGVTGPELLTKKTLPELILPMKDRIDGVVDFLEASDPTVERNVVEINDIYGPAGVVPQLECIVGSLETERGCVAINKRRKSYSHKPNTLVKPVLICQFGLLRSQPKPTRFFSTILP